jgi:hypothetical protein
MPNVPGNPAQVMRDQAKLIAANPLEAIGRMVVGALQGGVFGPGLSGIRMASGGLFGGNRQTTAPAAGGSRGLGSLGGVGGSYSGPGGPGGYTGGGFQAGGGNFGNYGTTGGFNSGLQSGSGFTYDR